ncbi:hypothetical protein ASG87_00720 [Frateuria sp. Soil773]|uniref:hypothetical protein n=1 Tax=Frateuria sp. Soil773 TaxID=1736407 RepID=UPI0006F8F628|nr:hypothetical protein [Frateuria sp. Soil773]KRE92473.1 hypothetical protein ASG87_00720 [Frateuria sp. Soil773]
MKRLHAMAFFGLLCATGGSAWATSGALSPFRPRLLPVLVNVNSHGKITDISPAIELSPPMRRLLEKNLGEMITKPAFNHGKPVSSQFVVNLALKATPRAEGDYDAQFSYVSTSPVPFGNWHWVNIEGRRFALAGPNMRLPERVRFHDGRAGFAPPMRNSYPRSMPSPPVQNATQHAPSPAPASAPARGR